MNLATCHKRNIHGRSLQQIQKSIESFEPAPDSNLILNPASLFELAEKAERKKIEREQEARRIEEEERRAVEEFNAEGVSFLHTSFFFLI